MHHAHPPPPPPHVRQINVPPQMHHQQSSHPSQSIPLNVSGGQQQQKQIQPLHHHHQLSNINVNLPPPTASRHTNSNQPHSNNNNNNNSSSINNNNNNSNNNNVSGGSIQRDQNRLNHTQQSRLNAQMNQQTATQHGRHNIQSGPKAQYLSKNNTGNFSGQANNTTSSQHIRHQHQSQPKQILQPHKQVLSQTNPQHGKQQQQSLLPHPKQSQQNLSSTNQHHLQQQQQQQQLQPAQNQSQPVQMPKQNQQQQHNQTSMQKQTQQQQQHQPPPASFQLQPAQQSQQTHFQQKPQFPQQQPHHQQSIQPALQTVDHAKLQTQHQQTPPSVSVQIGVTTPSPPITLLKQQKQHQQVNNATANNVITNNQTTKTTSATTVTSDNKIIEVSAENGQPATNHLVETLANSKEKTPMCLVNELARFNKIQHQYRLTSEQGPAHKKRFTVTLNLGDEEYTAEGASIKKAQHTAAGTAIAQTTYKHPPAKTNRLRSNGRTGNATGNNNGNIKPTVELNALAMKRGEITVYMIDPPNSLINNHSITTQQQQQQQQQQTHPMHMPPIIQFMSPNQNQSNFNNSNQYDNFRRNNHTNIYQRQRFNFDGSRQQPMGRNYSKIDNSRNQNLSNFYGLMSTNDDPFKVTLQVGQRKFTGVGNTMQAARHDAAAKALEVLKPLTPADDSINSGNEEDLNSETKSPISLVHEMALKRNLTVSFEVQSEKGPPHMKTFITLCKVGNITTEGKGNGKKISKKRAAERMVSELKKLPPLSPVQNRIKPLKRKPQPLKRKTRNLIKENPEEDVHVVNPISRLIHIAQGNKSQDPAYTLIEERGAPRRREFVMEVSAVGHQAQGIGSTKKLAKRQAAENLLTLIGVARTSSPVRDVAATSTNTNNNNNNNGENNVTIEKQRKIKFQEKPEIISSNTTNSGGSTGRQLVPGLLLMQQDMTGYCTSLKTNINNQTTATIANEFLNSGTSPTADALSSKSGGTLLSSSSSSSSSSTIAAGPIVAAKTTTATKTKTIKQTPAAPVVVSNSPAISPTLNDDSNSNISTDMVRPKDQLLYLGRLLGFNVNFSDFPKGNHSEFLTLITLSTDPPQLCHGAGNNTDASHDQAAMKALQMLSKLGLDNVVKPKINQEENMIKPILSNGIKQ